MSLDEIKMSEGSFKEHETDEWLPGEIVRIEEGDDYGFGPTIRFVLVLDDDVDDAYPETWALTSQKLSPRSKLYGWVQAIDPGLIPQVGQSLQYRKLEGRRVEAMFEAGDGGPRVTKIRAAKVKTPVGDLQGKQRAATAAKKSVRVVEDDEAPF